MQHMITHIQDIQATYIEEVAAYVRVSSQEQKLHGLSIDAQKQKLIEYAEKHNLKYTPLQEVFDEALKKADYDYLTTDGVHTTTAGSELIKREWIKTFNEIR